MDESIQPGRCCGAMGAALILGLLAATLGSCGPAAGPGPKPWKSRIDSARAFSDLQEFAAMGGMSHRTGTTGLARGRALIKKKLAGAGITDVRSQTFTALTPDGGGKRAWPVVAEMENIIGVLPGNRDEAIAIACHYDTKILDETFVGANDGCSGVALTLELARQLVEGPKPEFTIWFVFFDGEEAFVDWHKPHNGGKPDNCYGSRHMASQLADLPLKALVLLDMVADKDLELDFDVQSDTRMLSLFAKRGREIFGVDPFGKKRTILDDHVPFIEAGLERSAVLIDLNYGGSTNAYWHTHRDTEANCSPQSLDKVGTLVLESLPSLSAWLAEELEK